MPDVVQLEYLPEESPIALETYYQKLMVGFQGYVQSLKAYIQDDRSLNILKISLSHSMTTVF